MKTIDNLKATKTGVERDEELHIRWLFSNLVNQPLKAPPALGNCAHAGSRSWVMYFVQSFLFQPAPSCPR